MWSRKDAINQIYKIHDSRAIYIASTGYIARAVYAEYPHNENIFYMQGSMGMAPCIGLGIALNTKRDVVVITGDASLLMHLGITHTIRDEKILNLYVYVLDNNCHESVGGFSCSKLEDTYTGNLIVMKITKDGKPDRVGLDCIKNTETIKRFLKEK